MARHLTAPTRTRSTKVRALLAIGLLIGIGATLTFARWTDRAYIEGGFQTSEFNLLVSTDSGLNWVEADQASQAATLNFSLSETTTLEPNKPVYAPVSLKTADNSLAAAVKMAPNGAAGSTSPLLDSLYYTVALMDGIDEKCDADLISKASGTSALLIQGAKMTGDTEADLVVGASGTDDAHLCFSAWLYANTTDSSLAGESATARWEFSAESVTS